MKIGKIIFTTALSAFACFALCQQVQSATDTPDPGSVSATNTADGAGALAHVTSGIYNAAFGFDALFVLSDGNFSTGIGAGALLANTASQNTAVGAGALLSNVDGGNNNAVGAFALFSNVSGSFNNAFGREVLLFATGSENDGFGDFALEDVTTGEHNTGIGDDALASLTEGNSNTAVGDEAGNGLTTGNQNVYIGAGVSPGAPDELRFIRIGDTSFTDYDCFIAGINGRAVDAGTAAFVFVDANQKVGTNPVDAGGNIVKPQVMLNEALKQQKRIAELEATVLRQQKGMEVLTAQLKEQAAQIQKVSAQLEVNKPAPQVVANKP